MRKVASVQARARFGELLDRVARGEEIAITRQGTPVARLIPVVGRSRDRAQQVGADLFELQDEIRSRPGFKPLTQKEIKDAINEGRDLR